MAKGRSGINLAIGDVWSGHSRRVLRDAVSSREAVEVMKIVEYSWDIYMCFYIRFERHI